MKRSIAISVVLIFLFSFGIMVVYSQDTFKPINQSDIDELNLRTIVSLNESDCKVEGGLNLINIFLVDYNGVRTKRNFADRGFEQYIEPVFKNANKKTFLAATTLICKRDGTISGVVDVLSGTHIFCLYKYSESAFLILKSLAHKVLELDLEIVYAFEAIPRGYFGVAKNGDVYFLKREGNECHSFLSKDVPYKVWTEYWAGITTNL